MNDRMRGQGTECPHLFVARGWTWRGTVLPRRRYVCEKCDFVTRRYDQEDKMALRPIHRHMSVAMPGYNVKVPAPVRWMRLLGLVLITWCALALVVYVFQQYYG